MYTVTTLRDKYGSPTGFIWIYTDGRQEIRNKYGSILGFYNPNDNTTRDKYGSIQSFGNTLSMFLTNEV